MRITIDVAGIGVSTPIPRPAPGGLRSVYSPEARRSPIPSPEAFETLFGETSDLLCVRDLRGKLMRLNLSWSTILGFSLPDLRGAPLLDLIHPHDVWATHDIMQGVGGDQMVIGFSNRYRLASGGHRRFEWTARRFGDYVFGVGRDVTGR